MEAERRPVGDDAPPRGSLPPVAAGDGAVVKVTREEEEEEEESPWKRRSEIAWLGCDGSSSEEELRSRTVENSDLQMSLI